MKKVLSLVLLILSTLVFTGCGGGSSSTTPDTVTGQFIDATVKGLDYTCSSGAQGTTDLNGEYTCNTGENVTFFIGPVAIGTIAAQSTMITPYSLFPNDNNAALNLARLLQSLDMSADPDLIDLNTTLIALLPAGIDFTSDSFETEVETALGITLISPRDAQTAMDEAIANAGGSVSTDLNHIPVAHAGDDQNIPTGTEVTLDGTTSTDADSDTLTYVWSITYQPEGSGEILLDASAVTPKFTPDTDGAYVFQLIVNDGTANSAVDSIKVTASTDNSAPVAKAGENQNVKTDTTVSLNGFASSDADRDPLTYAWTMRSKPAESATTLENNTTINPTFTADADGTYVLTLIVHDGLVDSAPSTVTIVASIENSAPVANAGENQNVGVGTVVTLDANTSMDADGDDLMYTWSISYKPETSQAELSGADTQKPTFSADVFGTYVFELLVNDGLVDSAVDTVVIIVGRYTRSDSEVVTDHITGLEWQDNLHFRKPWVTQANYDAGSYFNTSGDTAATFCTELTLDGGGWRLPNLNELANIVDMGYARYAPVIDPVFKYTASFYYWSSTTDAGSTNLAWYVSFSSGYLIHDYGKNYNFYVRCVR